jgi:hypothetical protein
LGVVLEAKDYQIDNDSQFFMNNQPNYDWTPFNPSNILEFQPRSKKIEHRNVEVERIIELADESFREGNIEESFEIYSQCVSLYI